MTAVTTPPVLASPGEPECGERNHADHLNCARPPGHKGGHVDRHLERYWQAEEPASVAS